MEPASPGQCPGTRDRFLTPRSPDRGRPALSPSPAGAPDSLLGRGDRSSAQGGWEGSSWTRPAGMSVAPPVSFRVEDDLNVTSRYDSSSLS